MRALLLFLVIPIILSFPGQEKIKGKVVDKLDGYPLAGVNIVIIGTPYGTSSDSSGFFELLKPPPDSFRIRASLIGYSQTSLNLDSEFIPSSVVTISLERDIIQLSDITVTESREESNFYTKDLMQIPIIKAREMAGNLNDIVRSLSTLPGFAKPYDYRNDLMVRGGSPAENLFLIDGIIVPSINHFSNQGFTGGPVSFIDPTMLKGISVSSGGFNAVYGDKLSSVLDLELRQSSPGEFKSAISASGTQFSFNSEYSFNENINYIISARRSFLDPLFHLYGFTYYPEYYDLAGKLSFKLNRLNSLSFLFIGIQDAVKFFDPQSDVRSTNSRAVGNNQLRYISGISFKHLYNGGIFNLNLSRNVFKYNTIPNHYFSNNSFEAENSLKGDLSYELSDHISVKIGSIISLIDFRIDAQFYNYRSSYNEVFDAVIKNNKRFLKSGSYFNYSHQLKDLEFNAGVRLDYFSPMSSEKTLSPRFGASYKIDNQSVFLKTGVYHQTPSYVWLSGDLMNLKLKSLRSVHFIAGYDYSSDDQFYFKTEAYLKNYSNYPVSVKRPYLVLSNTGAEFSGTDNNFASFGIEPLESKGTGTSMGIEFSVSHKNKNIPLTFDANTSLSKTHFSGLDGIKRASSFDQPWIINIMASYIFNETWSANLKFFFASGSPYTPYDKSGLQKADEFNKLRMPAVHSLDIRVEKRFSTDSGSMIYLDLKNVYNQENLFYYYYDSISNKVTHDPVIKILPTFGITLEI